MRLRQVCLVAEKLEPVVADLTAVLGLEVAYRDPLVVYFGITIILSLFGWCGLARVVRGKILELRMEDYVMAARLSGMSEPGIIRKHLLPGFLSYLIVHLTLAVPYMILAETSLSFLGSLIWPTRIG